MRLLADENVHPIVVRQLRIAGYNVEWVAETSPGVSDFQILDRADIGELILITYDRDFGDLIFNHILPKPMALIYSRLGRAEPRYIAGQIIQILNTSIIHNHIHVIKTDGICSKPFPAGA